jgi:hypothetical protein
MVENMKAPFPGTSTVGMLSFAQVDPLSKHAHDTEMFTFFAESLCSGIERESDIYDGKLYGLVDPSEDSP